MRKCTKCGVEKMQSEFFVRDKKTGRMHAQCKDCYKIHRAISYQKHYKKYREFYLARAIIRNKEIRTRLQTKMLEYLSDKACVICHENDIRVLEFDHLDPKQKSFSIAKGISLRLEWDVIVNEMSKCRILCANCHKKHTALQQGWYKKVQI